MSKTNFYVNYSDKPAPYTGLQFPRASVPCDSLKTAQALVKVYKGWGDRNRVTITDKPTGKISVPGLDKEPLTIESVSLIDSAIKIDRT